MLGCVWLCLAVCGCAWLGLVGLVGLGDSPGMQVCVYAGWTELICTPVIVVSTYVHVHAAIIFI